MVESLLLTLPDSCKDRKCTDAECPTLINRPLPDDILFNKSNGLPNWRNLKELMCREGPVSKSQCMRILQQILNMLKSEPNLA